MRRNFRSAFTFMELAVAIVLATALSTLMLQAAAWSTAARHEMEMRQAALILAENELDRLAAAPRAEIAPHGPRDVPLDDAKSGVLADARLTTEIRAVAGDADARQLIIEIHWKNTVGEHETPIRLTTWVWRP